MSVTTLLIMRHAKSDWNTGHETDFDRVLSKRGINDAPQMGKWIVDHNYTPDHVICSNAERVKQTITLAGEAWNLTPDQIQWESAIYNANLSTLLTIIVGDIQENKINMLVGHNPGVSELILYLTGDQVPEQATGNLMPTSAVTVLELNKSENLKEYGSWKILDYMKPKLFV